MIVRRNVVDGVWDRLTKPAASRVHHAAATGRTAQITPRGGIGIFVAAILALAQWPLVAIVNEKWAFTTEAGLLFVVLGCTTWILAQSERRQGARWILAGSILLTAGTYLALLHHPLLTCLSVILTLWMVTTLALVRTGSAVAKGTLLASGFLLVCVAVEWLAGWPAIVHRVKYIPADAAIGSVSRVGQIDGPDFAALRQLVPLGWARHRKTRRDGEIDFDVEYHSDTFGSRVVPARPHDGADCFMFGCSFIFGEGLSDEHTIAARVQARQPSLRVFDFGIPDGGTSDSWIHLTRRIESGQAPAWSLYFFMFDHFRRTAVPDAVAATQGSRPIVVVGKNGPVYAGPAKHRARSPFQRFRFDLLARSRFYQLVGGDWEPDDGTVNLVADLGKAMDDTVRARVPGGRFLFVFLPTRITFWQAQIVQLKNRLRQRGVALLECDAMMSEYERAGRVSERDLYLADDHPSAAYAKLVAGWVSEYLDARRPEQVALLRKPTAK